MDEYKQQIYIEGSPTSPLLVHADPKKAVQSLSTHNQFAHHLRIHIPVVGRLLQSRNTCMTSLVTKSILRRNLINRGDISDAPRCSSWHCKVTVSHRKKDASQKSDSSKKRFEASLGWMPYELWYSEAENQVIDSVV